MANLIVDSHFQSVFNLPEHSEDSHFTFFVGLGQAHRVLKALSPQYSSREKCTLLPYKEE